MDLEKKTDRLLSLKALYKEAESEKQVIRAAKLVGVNGSRGTIAKYLNVQVQILKLIKDEGGIEVKLQMDSVGDEQERNNNIEVHKEVRK